MSAAGTLNGWIFSWKNIYAGVGQVSVLGLLMFLIYTNDFPDGIESIYEIFPDDTLLFFIVNDNKELQITTKKDLENISKWIQ